MQTSVTLLNIIFMRCKEVLFGLLLPYCVPYDYFKITFYYGTLCCFQFLVATNNASRDIFSCLCLYLHTCTYIQCAQTFHTFAGTHIHTYAFSRMYFNE
jgi:hypothetical protein